MCAALSLHPYNMLSFHPCLYWQNVSAIRAAVLVASSLVAAAAASMLLQHRLFLNVGQPSLGDSTVAWDGLYPKYNIYLIFKKKKEKKEFWSQK